MPGSRITNNEPTHIHPDICVTYFYSFFFSLPQTFIAQQANLDKTDINLLEKIEAEPEAWFPVYILLTDRVDIKALDAELTLRRASRSERAETVISALRAKAEATQGGLLEFLRSNENVKTGTVKGYWAANAIFAEINADMVAELGQRGDVEWIEWDAPVKLEGYESATAATVSPDGTESGLRAINAPEMWAMGYTGYGQAGLVVDTGTDPSHPALMHKTVIFMCRKTKLGTPIPTIMSLMIAMTMALT